MGAGTPRDVTEHHYGHGEMCGICGIVGGDGSIRTETIAAQLKLQHHRGPNAAGRFEGESATIAQNRLSIIDVEGGDPPITNEDGSIGVVLNGEIYNFLAVREQLLGDGHSFQTRGDTEVIAHLAERLDPVGLARELDGMFAFAVWDDRRKRLVLGRDRIGKKPLYYWWSADLLVFGSEIKAVLAHPAVPRRLAEEALPAYLAFGYVPTPRTIYEGIHSLPPGCVLHFEPGAEPSIARYWAPPTPGAEHARLSFAEAASETRRLLAEAVERRLVADVPVGAFLSGGIDSSAVVALMAARTNAPVPTFTIGFEDDEGFDERPFARLVAEMYKTDHHEFVVRPEAIDLVERLVWHHDQPFGDSSAIPTYLLNELTAAHLPVSLSGDGGDELFAGYERFPAALAVNRFLQLPASLRRRMRTALSALSPRLLRGRVGNAARFAAAAELGLPNAYISWLSFIDAETRVALLHGGSDDWAEDELRELWAAWDGAPPLDRLLGLNLRTYLLDDLLPKADRMSMAHGLEVRSPFLDSRLIDFAFSLPPGHKVRTFRMKRVLKEALKQDLPAPILRRRKRGFGVPLDRWFREDLKAYMNSMLGPGARVREQLDGAALDAVIDEHNSGTRSRGHALWTLLTLEVFLRREGW